MMRLRPAFTAAASMAAALAVARMAAGLPTALGAGRARVRRAVVAATEFDGDRFHNRLPTTTLGSGQLPALLRSAARRTGTKPVVPIPLWPEEPSVDPVELAVTWYGHASVLLEIGGRRVLADPVWSERVSPSRTVGPRRLHPVPRPLADLPTLDAVIISHDHYDHLDLPTIRHLARYQQMPFVVPRGVGEHLRRWGVPERRIVELDWDAGHTIGGLTLTCTEARHFSGRGLTRDDTLWSSWVLVAAGRRVFFGGDTGYTPAFAEIGHRYGPFDLSLLPIGAYGDQWPDIHLDPEQAVQTHRDLDGGVLVPIHWATYDLAFHPWVEPVERLLAAASDLPVALPMPGQRVVIGTELPTADWWSVPGGRC